MSTLDAKRQNAIAAARALITLLERCRVQGWPSYIYPILDALNEYELDRAIHLYKVIPMPNMGGFLDLVLSEQNGHSVRDYDRDNELLEETRGALGKSIGNLRVFMEYELDHPLVHIPDAG